VWRTGANEATEITITKNIQVNGTLLLAGTYSLFTIPEEKEWTIIINQDVGQTPGNVVYEPFTIQIEQRNDVADLLILWDKTRISIPIKFI
jgi:hypothetical protein